MLLQVLTVCKSCLEEGLYDGLNIGVEIGESFVFSDGKCLDLLPVLN